MNLTEAIKTRRSIRKFTEQPIKREVISEIIESTVFAPSWKNTQVTSYIAIDNRNAINDVAKACMGDHNANILKTTSLLMVVTVKKGRCGFNQDGTPGTVRGDTWQMFDCGVSCQTFCLAAHEKKVGTVIMGLFDHLKLADHLKIEDNREVVAVIACGYHEGTAIAPKRKSAEEILTFI